MLNPTCPKCQQRVTDEDHETGNVDEAVRLGSGEAATIHGRLHFQHRACPVR